MANPFIINRVAFNTLTGIEHNTVERFTSLEGARDKLRLIANGAFKSADVKVTRFEPEVLTYVCNGVKHSFTIKFVGEKE